MSNIHLVPWGRGRVGLDILYKANYTTPWNGAMDLGTPGPPDLGCDRAGLGPGVGRTGGKGLPERKIRMGSWGQDAWVSPFPCCCLTSCAVLSFILFFFFFKIEI